MTAAVLETHFRRQALALFTAYRALRRGETPVACVLVDADGSVLAYGYNGTNDTLNGTRHAEFIAADKVLRRKLPRAQWGDAGAVRRVFRSVTVYVTVEPCIMCAAALKQLGVRRVVYGCGNDRFGGNGTVLAVHQDGLAGENYDSFGGILRTEAVQLLRNFYIQENDTAPQPKKKKNKQLEEKEYPENIDFAALYTEDQFERFYWPNQKADFYRKNVTKEISPYENKGYSVRQLLAVQHALAIPNLDQLYDVFSEEAVAADLEVFYDLFYDIGDDREVSFEKKILTVEQLAAKRRRVD